MASGAARLGLGTVQFGLDYGVTNRAGRPSQRHVDEICAIAADAGIDVLDTASLYGESEAAIGRSAPAGRLRVVTKTVKLADASDAHAAVGQLCSGFTRSLDRLSRRSVDALLFHDADDLLGPYGDALWAEMLAIKARGQAGRIGLSIYAGAQIDMALDRYPIEIVQLPFNPLDRRLVEGGQLDRLAAAGAEIHARSLFLQGLLLQSVDAIEPRFGNLRDAIAELHAWGAEAGLSALETILALAFSEARIDRFVVGVTGQQELRDIVSAVETVQRLRRIREFSATISLEPRLLDPSKWHQLG